MVHILIRLTALPIPPSLRRLAIAGCLFALTLSSGWAGGGIFGTKTSPISSTTTDTSMGAMPMAQMFVALLIVLAMLRWLMPLMIKKYTKSSRTSSNGIKVQESATLGAGSVYVIETRGKSFLIGATPNSINCLADLTSQKEEPFLTFQDMVDEAMPKPMGTQKQAMGDLLGQLERLKTLGTQL